MADTISYIYIYIYMEYLQRYMGFYGLYMGYNIYGLILGKPALPSGYLT